MFSKTHSCCHCYYNSKIVHTIINLDLLVHYYSHSMKPSRCRIIIKLILAKKMMQATLAAVCCLSVILCAASELVTPVVYVTTSGSKCGQNEDDQQLMKTLKKIKQQLPPPGCNPPSSCKDVIRCNSSASSGYYQIQAANGSAVQVYCDMEGTNCGGEGGWMRVAHLNMTDPSSQCPADFRIETANSKRFCIRDISSAGCVSMLFKSFELSYSQVCGYARGYSQVTPDGFSDPFGNVRSALLSGNYVDGVSITYGTPPTHVWTYAAGARSESHSPHNCPCNTQPGIQAPSFLSSDYYCEAGSSQSGWRTNDPLWDGMQCGGQEGPCCNHPALPWFTENTLTSTIAPIDVRLCLDEDTDNENIGIERLEIYVK